MDLDRDLRPPRDRGAAHPLHPRHRHRRSGTGSTRCSPPTREIDYTATGGIAASYPEVKAVAGRDAADLPAPDAHARPGRQPGRRRHGHRRGVLPQPDGAAPGRRAPSTVVEFGGIYHHDLVRTPDGWRSRRLFEELVWKAGHVASPMDTKPEGSRRRVRAPRHQGDGPRQRGRLQAHPRPDRRHLAHRRRLEGPGPDLPGRAPRSSYRQAAHHPARLPARPATASSWSPRRPVGRSTRSGSATWRPTPTVTVQIRGDRRPMRARTAGTLRACRALAPAGRPLPRLRLLPVVDRS